MWTWVSNVQELGGKIMLKNSLAIVRPDLVAEWHPTKNGDLTPENVAAHSNKKVWWYLSYDDPKTGRHYDFEWEARVNNRVSGDAQCPFLTNNAVWPGYNDLASQYPQVAAEWNYSKNGMLTPENVSAQSKKKVWWILSYDDPYTKKHFEFEWQAVIANRTILQAGCPYMVGKKVWTGYNDLASRFPELIKEWHPEKNGNLNPEMILYSSNKKVWWKSHYTDPKSGKEFVFEWEARILDRTINGHGCPFIYGNRVWAGFNDLLSQYPEIAAEWHPEKNGDLTPDAITYGSHKVVWWLRIYYDPALKKTFKFEWKSSIKSRTLGKADCPYLTGRKLLIGYNDLASRFPELIKEWHPTKNGSLTPENVIYTSSDKVWWILSYDDPQTKKHFEFEWEASVNSRIKGCKCPYITGHAVWTGYNDLASRCPELLKEWDYEKNAPLTPDKIMYSSNKKVWWHKMYTDSTTGKSFDFSWKANVDSRAIGGCGCPYLSNRVWPGYNDLESCYPELSSQWDYERNYPLTPNRIAFGSTKKVWWILSYDDPQTKKHFDFKWSSSPNDRVNHDIICPYLTNRAVWPGYNDLVTLYPEIAAEWHPEKNKKTPDMVFGRSNNKKVWWKCCKCGCEWKTTVHSRTVMGSECPQCRKNYNK